MIAAGLWWWPQHAASLTWTRENAVDASTVALYHFNETGGVIASNAAGAQRALTLEDARMRFSDVNGWGSGMARAIATTGLVASTLRFGFTTEWESTDLTMSFWLRVAAPPMVNTQAAPLAQSPWGARCGAAWLPDQPAPLELRVRNVPVTVATISSNTLYDGTWHHLAWAYDAGTRHAAVFFDDVLQTNVSVAAGESSTPLTALTIGEGFAGASLGSVHIDELLISAAYITDFSDGYIPEPAHGALAGWGLLCACRAARRAVR